MGRAFCGHGQNALYSTIGAETTIRQSRVKRYYRPFANSNPKATTNTIIEIVARIF
jgi:hypothetical protein